MPKLQFRILLLAAILGLNSLSFAQKFSLNYAVGYNQYGMSDLVAIQDEIVQNFQNSGIGVKAIEQFPNYLSGELQASFDIYKKSRIGLFFESSSSGSRINYRDNTGELTIDQLVKRRSVGLLSEIFLFEKGLMGFFYYKAAFISTTLDNDESLRLFQDVETRGNLMKTDQFGFEPGLLLRYAFHRLIFSGYSGYQFTNKGDLKIDQGDSELIFLDQTPDGSFKSSWNGWRFGFILGVAIL